MSIWIEDSPRNLAKWSGEVMTGGLASGTVLTPFATPYRPGSKGTKRAVRETASMLILPGRQVWLDPMTHALQMSGVGDFRYYDQYDLWGGPRGDLTTSANRVAHVEKVFELQDDLGLPHLAPTLLLHAPLSNQSLLALEVSREAIRQDPDCALAIAGTSSFWSSSNDLDAHIGSLASLNAGQWFVSSVKSVTSTPVVTTDREVFGICRTVRSLADSAYVHVSHGDLSGLPAVAAGATSVGTGWDQRQRSCSQTDYQARVSTPGGGGWFERPTLGGLLGVLSRNEAELLETRDAPLVARLGGLPAPGANEAFVHHIRQLGGITAELLAQ